MTGQRKLTCREAEVLRLVAEGLTNAEIGRRLYVTEDTVKSTIVRILNALGARSRAHAVWLGLVPERVRATMVNAVEFGVALPVDGAA